MQCWADNTHPSSCTEVNCLMLLASCFSPQSWLCLIDLFLKRDRLSLCVSSFFIIMALLPFFAEFRDGSYSLNTKRSSMEHPQCTCGRLCYAWTTDADPQRDIRAASVFFCFVFWRIGPSLSLLAATEGQRILFLQRLFPFSDYYDFVLFGTSVGFTLVQRDSLIVERKARLDWTDQTNPASGRCDDAVLVLPAGQRCHFLKKHTSSWLPVCS